MAQVTRREGKLGVSYTLTANLGRDASGKQIRRHTTYKPPENWSKARQDREAQKAADKFEDGIKKGYQLDNRQTFAEFAEYALELKRREGTRESTIEAYRLLLERINPAIGHMKLIDILPTHLDVFYRQLSETGGRKTQARATAKIDLATEMKARGFTQKRLAEIAGISVNSVATACKSHVNRDTATKIANALKVKPEKIFSFEEYSEPLSNKTILEHHRLIRTILATAEKKMLVPYNAADKATPPHHKRKEPNYFQPETVYKILDAAETESLHHKTFINLAVVTGARRGEIIGLRWKNIDFDTGVTQIDHSLLYSSKRGIYESDTKTGEHRTVRLPMEVIDLLRQLKIEQAKLQLASGDRWTDTGYVFTQDNGKPTHPTSWAGWLNKFSQKHGLPHINPHAFRHTAASMLIANGVDDVTVSKYLGHKDPNTTRGYYAHLIEAQKAAAEDTISEVLFRNRA